MKKIYSVKRTDPIQLEEFIALIVICDNEELARKANPHYVPNLTLHFKQYALNPEEYENSFEGICSQMFFKSNIHPMWVEDLNTLEVRCLGTADPSITEDEIVFVQRSF